ncbi:MAG: ATP-grasp domain-containing protein [Candidatus Caldatribacteriaceae bacterium]
MSSQKAVLIFSGYNDRGVVAFCRFCKTTGIPFFIVAASLKDKLLLSSYFKNLLEVRDAPHLDINSFQKYREKLSEISFRDQILILPSTEFLNHFLLAERDVLESMGYVIPLCSENLYRTISNKHNFYILCQDWGISVPRELSPERCEPPFVIKPRTYFTCDKKSVNFKTMLVSNSEELEKYHKILCYPDVFIQEFVEGRSIYLLFYFGKDKTYSVYSQENFMQQYNGRSIIAAESTNFHEHPEVEKFVNLFLGIGFSGLVMVEVRLKGEKLCMIEANPRIWGPSQLINDANMDLFHRFALDFGLIEGYQLPSLSYREKIKYFWFGGIFEDFSFGNQITFHNYHRERFCEEFVSWLQRDVYLREDTLGIFWSELESCQRKKNL